MKAFQNYVLYLNKTVAENMGFGAKLCGCRLMSGAARLRMPAKILDLTESWNWKLLKLSG